MTLSLVIPNSSFGLLPAFRGELVPQAPSDEPASALLARLQNQPPAKPARTTRKPRK